ncbi:MAG TPA: 4Fe-4S dicluster domain-containing protein [Verrucomicrobiae bacterium]|nr:4Fe-4S dicluster domain-containing protein [Verrucomicrobiae bacterium]
MYVITIDETKCNVCGECVNICPNQIYQLEDSKLVVGNTAECSNCQSCVSVCSPEAITITEV